MLGYTPYPRAARLMEQLEEEGVKREEE